MTSFLIAYGLMVVTSLGFFGVLMWFIIRALRDDNPNEEK